MPETQGSRDAPAILDRIVRTKRAEVRALAPRAPELERKASEAPPPLDLAEALRKEGEVALMAEVKRRSPGAGDILPALEAAPLATTYLRAGAAAVSVLTDSRYFGGSLSDLEEVRRAVDVPLLRKDFVLDPLQLLEARGAGADAVLLIVRILPRALLGSLLAEAEALGLTALVEVHSLLELERALEAGAQLVGINNRNLQTFRTDLAVTLELMQEVPPSVTVVSESGIRTRKDVELLGAAGVDAVLVGEALLRSRRIETAARALTGCAKGPRSARPASAAGGPPDPPRGA